MTAVSSVADVDAWIAQLSECKQLPEADIKKLCDKVYKDHTKKMIDGISYEHDALGTRDSSPRKQRSTGPLSRHRVW